MNANWERSVFVVGGERQGRGGCINSRWELIGDAWLIKKFAFRLELFGVGNIVNIQSGMKTLVRSLWVTRGLLSPGTDNRWRRRRHANFIFR